MIRSLVFLLAFAGIAGGGTFWYLRETADQPTTFRTVQVERGDLVATIGSTATIEAEEFVDVGAQVQGMIKYFGTDPTSPSKEVDYGSHVEVGTLLAQIDPLIYETQVKMNEASLKNAKAQLKQAEANLALSKNNLKRDQILHERKIMTDADYDTAMANVQTCDAAVDLANAAIEQATANLAQAKANLGYTTIKSPVKGVIVDRRVNIGQTVVASLNAPSLFLLAKDLKRLQLWSSVNEADIGQIFPGQKSTFTVDAFPNRTFQGTVGQIRLNATMTSNVVTYTVVVNTDNSDGKLLPYMTANVKFETARRDDVLLVPSGALRWQPKPEQVVLDQREEFIKSSKRHEGSGKGRGKKTENGNEERSGKGAEKESGKSRLDPSLHDLAHQQQQNGPHRGRKHRDASHGDVAHRDPATSGQPKVAAADGGQAATAPPDADHSDHEPATADSMYHQHSHHDRGTVWIDENGFARSIQVRTGVTDGTKVEIVSGDVKEGMSVIVGEVRHEESSETKNPFAPTFFRRGGGGGQKQEKDQKDQKDQK